MLENSIKSSFDSLLDDIIDDAIAKKDEREHDEKSLPVLEFDTCLNWAKEQKVEYSTCEYVLFSVKPNTVSRNENDKFKVTVAVLDAKRKAISCDGKKGVSFVWYCKTIDDKAISLLNGKETIIIKL